MYIFKLFIILKFKKNIFYILFNYNLLKYHCYEKAKLSSYISE